MLQTILNQLHKVRDNGQGKYMACCPAHDDKSPSLSIKYNPGGRIFLYCHAQCDIKSITSALGITIDDLDPEKKYEYYTSQPKISRDKYDKAKAYLLVVEAQREQGQRMKPEVLKKEKECYWLCKNFEKGAV
jgi:hypothetical protein